MLLYEIQSFNPAESESINGKKDDEERKRGERKQERSIIIIMMMTLLYKATYSVT